MRRKFTSLSLMLACLLAFSWNSTSLSAQETCTGNVAIENLANGMDYTIVSDGAGMVDVTVTVVDNPVGLVAFLGGAGNPISFPDPSGTFTYNLTGQADPYVLDVFFNWAGNGGNSETVSCPTPPALDICTGNVAIENLANGMDYTIESDGAGMVNVTVTVVDNPVGLVAFLGGAGNPISFPDANGTFTYNLTGQAVPYVLDVFFNWAGNGGNSETVSCPTAPPPVDANVEFCVDVSCFDAADITTVGIFGTFTDPVFQSTATPLTETTTGIYCGTILLAPGDYQYKFVLNGGVFPPGMPVELAEDFAEGEPCTVSSFGFTNRTITVASGVDQTGADAVTFGFNSCDATCVAPLDRPDLPITFEDEATIDYNLFDFGGAVSFLAPDPVNPANTVVCVDKAVGAATFAGTIIANNGLASAIPFTATETTIAVRVWSPMAGTPVLLKIEDASNGGIFAEVLMTTGTMAWETMIFDFSTSTNQPLNLANTYDKIVIFFDFGNPGPADPADVMRFYFDDIQFCDGLAEVTTITDTTLYLDQNGLATLDVEDVVLDTIGTCSIIDNVELFRVDTAPGANSSNPNARSLPFEVIFDCDDLGEEQEVLVVSTDNNGVMDTSTVLVTVLDTISPVVVVNNPINLTLDATGNASVDLNNIVISATDNCTADADLLVELGRSLDFTGADIPTTAAMLTVTDESGNVTEIEITFNINFLSPPVACITDVNVTLDADCGAEIIPSMVISGGAGNLDFLQLEVVVQDADGLDNIIDGCGRFIYTVTDLAAPGSTFDLEDFTGCWGYINAEDKTSPASVALPDAPAELFCSELDGVNINTLASNVSRCYTVSSDGVPVQGAALFLQTPLGQKLAAGGGLPTFTDGCSNITICVNDMVAQGDACSDVVITRTFTARDGDCPSVSGEANAPTVASYDITFTRPSIADVMDVPGLAEFSCEDFEAGSANPQPAANDYPFLLRANGDTIFLGASFCNIGATFTDGPRISTCANTYKFIRTYTVIDWCEVGTIETFTQLVKVGDFTAPTLTAPTQDLNFDGVADNGPLFYSTNSQDCTGFFVIPSGAATDNCDATPTVSAVVFAFGDLTSTPIGPFNVGELAGGFPVGTHTLVYTASDDCDNTATLPVQFTIGDRTAPVAVCEDGLNISIGGAGVAVLRAADVDRASRDECGAVTLAISRDGVNFFPTLTLDCDDISAVDANGDPIADLEITLQVTDGSGNVNQCWLNVVVEDKAAPICIAPTPMAFNCAELDGEFPDDLDESGLTDEEINDLLDNAFGVANGVDNCPTTTITQSYVDNRTDCGTGTITRTFTVTDAQGLTSPQGACRQTITIIGIHDYTIVFPADAENSECVEPDYNDVTFEERGCDLITVATDIDTFSATADECFKLRITYEVLNWCEYNTESDAYFIPRDADNDNNLNEATYLHVIPRDETTLGDDLAFLDRDNNRTNNTTIGNLDTGDGGILAGSNAAGYGQDGSRGAYVYQQFIKIYDDTAPTLDVDGSVTEFCDEDGDCLATATLTFTVDDVCSPTAVNATVTLDAFINAGSDDIYTLADFVADGGNVTGNTTNANGTFTTTLADLPLGTHAIRVVATDGCGNTAVDLIVFTINDCKAPTPICINGLTATLMPDGNGGGMAAIWANDFIASPSEDCAGEVKFAIYRSDDAAAQGDDFIANPLDTGLVLTCADRGMLAVRIYAIDPNGNADYCETTLFVQQNQAGICPGPGATVAGLIATPNDEVMSGVEVNITDNGSMNDLRITDAGLYSFASLTLGEDYTVQPVYDPSVNLANVSTGDLITISRHILGVAEMTNAYQLLAGDVTQDNNINVVDIIAIRRVILGLDNGFTATNSWRFYTEAGAEVFNANNLNGNITDANFAAIEMGNVNDLFGARASFGLNIMDQAIEAGNVYEVAVSSADMAGFQGTLELAAGLELVNVNFTGANTAFNLNAAANGLIAVSHVGQADAFTLEVRATVNGKLSEMISVSDRMTVSEAYNAEGAAHGLNINFGTGTVTGTAFELGQNSPNPFAASTMITFELPTAAVATLTIQDIQGRVIANRTIEGVAGNNGVEVTTAELKGATGVLTYTLTAGDFTATKKMVVQ